MKIQKKRKYNRLLRKFVKVMTVFVILFHIASISINAQEIISAENEITEIVLEEDNDTVENEKKTLEEVMTETEKMMEQSTNTSLLTPQQVKEKELLEVGKTAFGTKIYASVSKEQVEQFMENPESFSLRGSGNSSGMLSWYMYSTPKIWLDGIGWVYCIEPYKAFPSGNWYDDGTWINDNGLIAILTWGFPMNYGGQHSLTDDDAYIRTFVAINAYLGNFNRSTVQSYGDSYVNMLLGKGDAQNIPQEVFTIHKPSNLEAHYNSTTNRQETDPYKVTGAVGNYWLENLPAGFYMVGLDGVAYSSMFIGGEVRIVTEDLSYSGTINFDIKTDITPRAAIKFQSSGVQTLLALKAKDPLPAQSTQAKFRAVEGSINGRKTYDVTHNPDVNINYDLSQVVVNIKSQDNSYNKNHNFNSEGSLQVDHLLPDKYYIKEIAAPTGLDLLTTTIEVIVTGGQTVYFTMEDTEQTGPLKIIKSTTTNKRKHDFTQVKVNVQALDTHITYNQNFFLNADGTLTIQNLPVGQYKISEIEVPPTMQLTAKPRVVTITASTQPTQESTAKLTNDETITHIHIKKRIANPTTVAPNTIDYTKIKIRIRSLSAQVTYDETIALDKNGELLVKNLPYGKYEVTEVAVPDYMDKDTTVHIISADTNDKTYEVPFNNVLIPANVHITKRNSEGGTMPDFTFGVYKDIERFADGTVKVYRLNRSTGQLNVVPEPKGTQANQLRDLYTKGDETKRILGDIVTGNDGTVTTLTMPYQFKNVYVQEIKNTTSAYVNMDYMPKLVKLNPASTAYVEFTNIIKKQGQVKIHKDDEDGNYVAWYFDLYRQLPNSTEKIYIETLATSTLTGIGNSTLIDLLDPLGQEVKFFIKEQPHTLYATDGKYIELTPAMFDSNTSIFTLNLTNKFKEIRYTHGKVAEENPYELTADGATFEIFDQTTGKVYAMGIATNKRVDYSTIRVDKILNNEHLYYHEVSAPAGFEIDETLYKVPTLTETFLETYTSGTPVLLRDTQQPLINKLKPATIRTKVATVDGGNTIQPNKTNITLTDAVTYDHLLVGKEYKLTGILMDKRLNPVAPLLVEGNEVTATTIFTPATANGTADVVFTLDTTGIDESFDIVLYEYLTYKNKPITEHTDPNDKLQTVYLTTEPQLVATGEATQEHILISFCIIGISLCLFIIARLKRILQWPLQKMKK